MGSAAAMLTESKTLAAIAARLGFASEYYLSRRFKQLMGMTPSEYRRRSQDAC